MIGEPYIRKKGKYFVIERKVDGKTEYIKTLPNVRELLVLLGVEASKYYDDVTNENNSKASNLNKRLEDMGENENNNVQSFA